MFTKELWETQVTYNMWKEPIDFLYLILGLILTIPLDIILSPIEIIGFVLYKIFNK